MTRRTCVLFILAALVAGAANAQVALETDRARLVIGDDATWTSLVDRATGRELAPEGVTLPLAAVRHGDSSHNASAASLDGDALTVRFADTDTVLTYTVEPAADWIVFRLASVMGTRPESMTLLQVPVSITEKVGGRLNIAWDDQTAVCMMAANRQADCRARPGRFATLAATTQDAPGPPLEGAAVALIICPPAELKAIAREASHAFGLLTNEDEHGTPAKDTELVRVSYWFMSFGEAEVDRVIEYCERAGIRQVMLSSGAWCTSPGHYLFNETRYPKGRESLKAVVDRLHEHDILVGMHTFVSKIAKRDPYVTPVPDKRLLRGVSASWRASDGPLETTLAEAVAADATEVHVTGDLRHWPGSSVVADRYWEGGLDKHLEVTIGDEIVRYRSIGPEGVWNTFIDCERGAWGTEASAHPAGAEAYHVHVDGCINGYVIDQETDLMAEVAGRIADIFNYCGFDMVYFDGGEDVDRRRFNYYASNFQEQAVARFAKRPVIHMGTVMTHLLWHSFARSSTVDHYINTLGGAIVGGKAPTTWPNVKEHIDRSVRYMLSVGQDMMPGELGWFGIWPAGTRTYTARITPEDAEKYRALGCDEGPVELPGRENTVMTGEMLSPTELRITVAYDGLQLDEIEYLMCKSLGYDVPISLQADFGQMEAHVLTPEILTIVREYETMRLARAVPEATREMLQEMGTDFALIRGAGPDAWVEVERVPGFGGTRELRAFVGALGTGSVATLWHIMRDGHVVLDLDPAAVRLVSFMGRDFPFETENGRPVIPVNDTRTTLICPALPPDLLRAALEGAEVRLREPEMIFVRAADFGRVVGEMALGSAVGVEEPDAFGDVLVATGRPTISPAREWYAEYTVNIPREGLWTIWGRVRYPTGTDDSFGFVVPGEEVTLSYGDGQILGNCGVGVDQWHWTGRGAGSTVAPPGQPLTRRLEAGPVTFRIYAREGPGAAARNPRLDLICFTEDVGLVPTDDDARERFGAQ